MSDMFGSITFFQNNFIKDNVSNLWSNKIKCAHDS